MACADGLDEISLSDGQRVSVSPLGRLGGLAVDFMAVFLTKVLLSAVNGLLLMMVAGTLVLVKGMLSVVMDELFKATTTKATTVDDRKRIRNEARRMSCRMIIFMYHKG